MLGAPAIQEKHVRLQLTHEWWQAITSGKKRWEFRADSKYWRPRLENATHIIFCRGTSVWMAF